MLILKKHKCVCNVNNSYCKIQTYTNTIDGTLYYTMDQVGSIFKRKHHCKHIFTKNATGWQKFICHREYL